MLKIRMPDNMATILDKVPESARPKDLEEIKFWDLVFYELEQMVKFAAGAAEPQIVLENLRTAGEQYIWEFFVNDLAKPKREEYNWHLQNTSQWRYAGCILLEGGRVSTHH